MSEICTTIAAATTAELIRRRDAAGEADLVELRLDTVQNPDVQGALAGRRTPVLVTCRPTWEGGQFRGSEEERRRLLSEALDGGAEYVDVEFGAGFDDLIRRGGRRVVVSTHDFTGVPADLTDRVAAMRASGAGVVKVAITAHRLTDCLPLLACARTWRHGASDPDAVWIAMGTPGLATRILSRRFGSRWTYAGEGVAPGQIPARRLCQEFRFRDIRAETAVYALVGKPVGHSLSPALHNAAFRAAGVDAVYVPLEAADADDFFDLAAALDVRGASVTVPHKVSVFERVRRDGGDDALDPVSRSVGAVNTLRRDDGRWEGRNTDVAGFLSPLSGRLSLAGARATILGAGGAARAAAVALGTAGTAVRVHARRAEAAREVARLAGGEGGAGFPPAGSWDLLVNATPVGMVPDVDATPWPGARFDGRLVYDLVYNPPTTRFLSEAAAAGCDTIGGVDMFVAQAREQSAWWTGQRPAAAPIRATVLAGLGQALNREAEQPS